MNVWDSYNDRLLAKGESIRDTRYNRASSYINSKLPGSLSYHEVKVNGCRQNAAVINSDNLNEKTIISLPGENLDAGSYVEWMETHWIITEKDANDELYCKCKMLQCNYLLRWIAADRNIIERWCIVDDGTKYLTGETNSSYNENGMSLGDTRIAITLPRDEYTIQLNRSYRFLIDDYASKNVLAYRLTKPFKIGGVYNGHGAMNFVLTEVNTEDNDNFKLHIADYYKYFPRECDITQEENKPGESIDEDTGKKVWL